MSTIWTIFCYCFFISAIFYKRIPALKMETVWICRVFGFAIIILVTWFFNIEGPSYLFWIGLGIALLKVKLLDINNATEKQIKDAIDYEEENENKNIDTTSVSIGDKIKAYISFTKKHYKLIIVIITAIVLFLIWCQIYYENAVENNNKNNNEITETKEEKVYTVDEICLNPSKYEGKIIVVEGTILNGTVPVDDDIGDLKPPLYGSNDNYIILNGDWPEQENVKNVLVKGEIYTQGKDILIKVDYYNFDNVTAIETTQNETSNTIFGKMREAASSYAFLNWNQFLNNPTSLAGTFIYIPGQVVDINYSNGMTYGLIDTLGSGNIEDMVSFTISSEVYDIKVGQIIAPMGVISSQTGSATDNITYQTVSTPLIEVSNPNLWKTSYEIDLSNQEICDFMYGTYTVNDENDKDEYLGKEFSFTSDSIGGHKYTYKDTIYNNPSISITSGNLMRGYDNMRISMNLLADNIGYSVGESELKVTAVSIYLKDGTMSVNADGGHASDYRKIS